MGISSTPAWFQAPTAATTPTQQKPPAPTKVENSETEVEENRNPGTPAAGGARENPSQEPNNNSGGGGGGGGSSSGPGSGGGVDLSRAGANMSPLASLEPLRSALPDVAGHAGPVE
mmetsp:Transcript_17017/g.39328  ORF Transcript_17017/g.39328 Transcript_17017/m.39328 type:complete len:116 (-) Transcript_17017:225-572(-)